MSVLIDFPDRPVEAVLHPTDLSQASLAAFHHALALTIRYGARLTLLHAVGRRSTDSWPGFPSVRATLTRWRAAGRTRALESAIRRSTVSKQEVRIRDPVAASLRHVRRSSVDLIVMATEGRTGLSRLVRPSRAEKLAREADRTTLFVPGGARPFVSGRTGEVRLRRILVPVSPHHDAGPAMLFAVRSAALLDDPSVEITLLHVGEGEERVIPEVPRLPFCRWSVVRRRGSVVEGIVNVAEELAADVVCMTTSWTKPPLVGTEGGVTEAVLRSTPCPLAAVPVGPR